MGDTQPAEQPLPADDETTASADAQQAQQPQQPPAPDDDGDGIKPANRYDG